MCGPGNVCVKKFEAERLPKSHVLKRAVLKPSFNRCKWMRVALPVDMTPVYSAMS